MIDHIRHILDAHNPSDSVESGYRDTMQRAIEASPRVGHRDHFDPGHFTASAFVLSPERDAILMIFHRKLQRWLQPGGHLEPLDADAQDAARREVIEETGLDAMTPLASAEGLFDVDVHEIPARGTEPAHLHLDLRFAFVADHRDVGAGDGVEAVRFVKLDEVSAVEADESVQRALRKLRGFGNRASMAEQ